MSSLYVQSAELLRAFLRDRAPLAQLVYSCRALADRQRKAAYALLLGTLRYKHLLDQVIESTSILKQAGRNANRALLTLMLYDMLFGARRSIEGGGALKKLLQSHTNELQACVARLKVRAGAADDEMLLPRELRFAARLPRYARINTMRCNPAQVHSTLAADGFLLQSGRFDHQRAVQWSVDNSLHYFLDSHIDHLLVFHPLSDLSSHRLVGGGCLILQDKASCMTAAVLDPNPSSIVDSALPFHVIDACAAPGNKTSHALDIAMQRARSMVARKPQHTTSKQPTEESSASPDAVASASPSANATPSTPAAASSSTRPPRPSNPSADADLELDDSVPRESRATGAELRFSLGNGADAAEAASKPLVKLEAFEVDPTRFQLLCKMMSRAMPTDTKLQKTSTAHASQAASSTAAAASAAASSSLSTSSSLLPWPCPPCPPAQVALHNRSFLDADPSDARWSSVRAILLDPTCSGSGMLHRIEQFYKHRVEARDEASARRWFSKADSSLATRLLPPGLEKSDVMSNVSQLADFQFSILSHALRFPSVRSVAYSTCSVHAAEDEAVLARVLSANPEWELDDALPLWPRRGEAGDSGLEERRAKRCVRSAGAEDACNGFFVAKLVKKCGQTAAAASVAQSKKRAREGDEAEDGSDDEEAEEQEDAGGSSAAPAVGSQTKRNRKKRERAKRKKLMQQQQQQQQQ